MSELAPGSVSLEDDNPSLESLSAPPPAPETPATPQQTAPPPAQEAEQEPDGVVVNPGGEKLVPLNAVVDLRGKLRAEKEAREAEKAELEQLRGKVKTAEAIAQEWQQLQPHIQKIKSAPPPQEAPKPTAPDANMVVGEHPITGRPITLADYTKSLDLYTNNGTPDLERGLEQLGVQRYQAKQQTEAAIQPFHQQTAQQQSAINFEKAASFKHQQSGIQVDRAILQKFWSEVPAEMSSQPGVAEVLWRNALAETVLQGKHKAPVDPPPPVQHTESIGGATAPTKELTQIDRNMMSAVGMKSKDYEDISSRYKPGEHNALE